MSLHISFELSASDLRRLSDIMRQVRDSAGGMSAQQIVDGAEQLLKSINRSDTTDFVRDRMSRLGILISMVTDEGWGLAEDDRERVLTALSYFSEPRDLIPDEVPGIGFLDDAIMIEIVCRELEHELHAYQEFLEYRSAEAGRGEDGVTNPQKADWLEERRQQLHSRMRRRRRGQTRGNKSKSPFSMF